MSDPLNAADRTAESLRLMGEDVLVRTQASEEIRASGLVVPSTVTENFAGMLFYGVVVGVGPGRLIAKGPRAGEREPLPWRVGDRVAFRQGFGVEVNLRDGLHYVVGRGNADYGHGIVCAWDPAHVHCWHLELEPEGTDAAVCDAAGCPTPRVALESGCFKPLPTCSSKGERLRETVLGTAVQRVEIPDAPPANELEFAPEGEGTFGVVDPFRRSAT